MKIAIGGDECVVVVEAATKKTGGLFICIIIVVVVLIAHVAAVDTGGWGILFGEVAIVYVNLGLLTHFGDFDVVVGHDGNHRGEKSDEINEGKTVMEDERSGGDGDDLLENSSDGEGDD